jgi:hypothetical protein
MHSWVGTDFVKRQELVDNFVTIDTQMKVNKDSAATAQSTIDTHKALTAVIGTGTVKEKHISDQDYKNWEDHRANTSNPHNVTIAQIGAAAASHVGTGGSSHAAVTTTTNGFMISTDKSKLDGVSTGANKTATSTVNGNILVDNVEKVVYTHPSTHPATMITEDTTHRFVTDTEKSTWNGKANTTVVTTSANGLMSSGDKTKLDGIATGAEVNQNAFSTVVAGGTSLVADAKSDSLTMTAGTGIVVSGNATTDTVTITVDSTIETITGAQTKADQAEVNAINFAKSFGLGDVAKDISSTDLNNLDATGLYRGITLTNAPGGVSSAFFILNFKASATVKTQFAIRYNQSTTDAYYWFRHNVNGTWGSWIQVATTAIVTTAANGLMIATDKVKLDGIETGAQVNDVTSVAGKVGAVTLGPTDVGAAPVSHSHVAADLPSATTAAKGIVQLSDSTSTTSSVLAATSTAVKAAYDLAAGRATTAVATTSANGLMSSTDKSKLDGVTAGAQPNQNSFANVTAGGVTIAADNVTDTLAFTAGSGITITGDATSDTVSVGIDSTVSRVGHTHTLGGTEIADVVITSVANDEVLAYDSTTAKWINQTPAEANLAIATRNVLAGSGLTGGGNLTADRTLTVNFGGTGSLTTVSRSDHSHTINGSSITDVSVTGLATNHVLKWNGSLWVNTLPTLNLLNDITISSPVSGHVIYHNGTNFANVTPATANLAIATRNISTGEGLLGGGNLTADRTLSLSWGGSGVATTASRSDHNHDTTYAKIANAQMTKLTLDTGYGASVSNTDLNALITTGFYFGNNLTNPPISGDAGTYRIMVEASSSVNCGQLATKLSTGQRFSRIMTAANTWTEWIEFVTDRAQSWTAPTMGSGITAYSTGSELQYTKVGNVVYVRGVVKGIGASVTVATLGAGYRPITMSHSFTCPTSGNRHSRFTISLTGALVIEANSDGTWSTADWHPINTSFIAD